MKTYQLFRITLFVVLGVFAVGCIHSVPEADSVLRSVQRSISRLPISLDAIEAIRPQIVSVYGLVMVEKATGKIRGNIIGVPEDAELASIIRNNHLHMFASGKTLAARDTREAPTDLQLEVNAKLADLPISICEISFLRKDRSLVYTIVLTHKPTGKSYRYDALVAEKGNLARLVTNRYLEMIGTGQLLN